MKFKMSLAIAMSILSFGQLASATASIDALAGRYALTNKEESGLSCDSRIEIKLENGRFDYSESGYRMANPTLDGQETRYHGSIKFLMTYDGDQTFGYEDGVATIEISSINSYAAVPVTREKIKYTFQLSEDGNRIRQEVRRFIGPVALIGDYDNATCEYERF